MCSTDDFFGYVSRIPMLILIFIPQSPRFIKRGVAGVRCADGLTLGLRSRKAASPGKKIMALLLCALPWAPKVPPCTEATRTATISMGHRNKPSRYSSPAPTMQPADRSYLQHASHKKTKSTWRCASAQRRSPSHMSTHHLPSCILIAGMSTLRMVRPRRCRQRFCRRRSQTSGYLLAATRRSS